MAYVEWMYALHLILNLKEGNVSLKMLFDIFNPIFGFKNIPFSNYFAKIVSRKKEGQNSVLDLQNQLLSQRKEQKDGL